MKININKRCAFCIMLLIFLTSCIFDDRRFLFKKEYSQLFSAYTKNDTIYFSSKKGDLDTFTVSEINTLKVCSIITQNKKCVTVKIKHLPFNKWILGVEMEQNGTSKKLDQELITVEKTMGSNTDDKYFIGINYRNFIGEINNVSNVISDNRFSKFEIKQYFQVVNQAANWEQYRLDSTTIIKLFWTEKYGLTGYELRNGETYEIKPNYLLKTTTQP
ncbi:MAG: hypothetical protein H7331_08970 [Bacteroidia bacterium]|nr:hypothetical protein [Bacteroidia bacterium]